MQQVRYYIMQITYKELTKNLYLVQNKYSGKTFKDINLQNLFKNKTKDELEKKTSNFLLLKLYLQNDYLKKYNQTINFSFLVVEAKDGEVRF